MNKHVSTKGSTVPETERILVKWMGGKAESVL